MLASSNHVVGFAQYGLGDLPDDMPPAPDTFYGFSKAATESLGALYNHRFGLHVVCLRIGTCADVPTYPRALWSWLSPDDCARLVDASLAAEGYHLVWGVSANTRRWWSTEGGYRIGYTPGDDAERYAATLGEPEISPNTTVGGHFCTAPWANGCANRSNLHDSLAKSRQLRAWGLKWWSKTGRCWHWSLGSGGANLREYLAWVSEADQQAASTLSARMSPRPAAHLAGCRQLVL